MNLQQYIEDRAKKLAKEFWFKGNEFHVKSGFTSAIELMKEAMEWAAFEGYEMEHDALAGLIFFRGDDNPANIISFDALLNLFIETKTKSNDK